MIQAGENLGGWLARAAQGKQDVKAHNYRALWELEKARCGQSRKRLQRETGEACRVRNVRPQGHG